VLGKVDKWGMEKVCIRRDLHLVAVILQVVADNQANEMPTVLGAKNSSYSPLDANAYNKFATLYQFLQKTVFCEK
jgi:hypothetical protein